MVLKERPWIKIGQLDHVDMRVHQWFLTSGDWQLTGNTEKGQKFLSSPYDIEKLVPLAWAETSRYWSPRPSQWNRDRWQSSECLSSKASDSSCHRSTQQTITKALKKGLILADSPIISGFNYLFGYHSWKSCRGKKLIPNWGRCSISEFCGEIIGDIILNRMTDRFSPKPRKGKHQRILIMSGQASNLPSELKLCYMIVWWV